MNTITTVRADIALINTLKEVALWHGASEIKGNWLSFTIMRPNEIFRTLRAQGVYTRPVNDFKGEAHVSLTHLTNKELLELDLVPNKYQFINKYGVSLMNAGLGGLEVTPVRDGLMAVKMRGERYLVIAENAHAVQEAQFHHVEMMNRFAYLWSKWQGEAKVVVKDGLDILKFENGLSVKMDLNAHTYCQTGYNGEYLDHANPYEFYWWLKRFF